MASVARTVYETGSSGLDPEIGNSSLLRKSNPTSAPADARPEDKRRQSDHLAPDRPTAASSAAVTRRRMVYANTIASTSDVIFTVKAKLL